jgi:nucleoside-diphosphate-sugar epimerase
MMMGACDFLCMARVLITGGAGFLGSHVVLELRRRGHSEIVPVRHDPHLLGMNTVPTDRIKKGTDLILAALQGLDIYLDVIEGVSFAECLRRRAPSHVFPNISLELAW